MTKREFKKKTRKKIKQWNKLRARSKGLKNWDQPKKSSSSKRKKTPGVFEFMVRMIMKCSWICAECGEGCYTSDLAFQLAAQAHILPKKTFRSIAKDPENIICLPSYGCGHHSTYDKSWLSARRMKIWPVVEKIILEKLIPKLTSEEYKKLPDFLKEKYEEIS